MKLIKPKYKIESYTAGNEPDSKWVKYIYGISKRFLYFFYRKLCHNKIVQYKNGGSSSSYEILTFETVDEAAFEIDKLTCGAGKITYRHWKTGKCVRTVRE